MGRSKLAARAGDRFADVFVARRCVELVLASASNEPGLLKIRVETGEAPWDDLVEESALADGSSVRSAYQIKCLEQTLDRDKMIDLVQSLASRRDFDEGRLALARGVNVPRVGNTLSLARLCDRARRVETADALLKSGLSKSEKSWFGFVRAQLGAVPDPAVMPVLCRFRIDHVGTEGEVRSVALRFLGSLYECDPLAPWEALLSFVGGLDDVTVVDAEMLERGVLGRFTPLARPTAKTLRRCRGDLLRAELADARRRRVLGVADDVPLHVQDVLVGVRQVAGPPGSAAAHVERPLVDELRRASATEPTLLMVLGGVGSGKTELLAAVASQVAAEAKADESSPLPLRLHARDLVERPWEEAVQLAYPATASEVEKLVRASKYPWVLLIDGFDEAGPRAESGIDGLRSLLRDRLHAVVVASRPNLRPHLPGASEIWLANWTDVEVDSFQERWATVDPKAVERLRAASGGEALRSLLRSPLTATMCLLVASANPDDLKSRAALFAAVTERLFHDWASSRSVRPGDAPWELVAPAMRKLALGHLRGEPIDSWTVRRILRRELGAGSRAAELAIEGPLGVLVRRGDEFDFIIRGVPEHLAGQELATGPESALVAAARTSWGEEAVRHAIGYLSITRPERVPAAVLAILDGEELSRPGLGDEHLRSMLSVVRGVADAGENAAPVATEVTSATMRRLVDEESIWVGDRMVEAVRELAAVGGPCWELLEQEIAARLSHAQQPAAWYAARDWDGPERWLELRFQRDPDVRAVAASRLARWSSDPVVRSALCEMLSDAQVVMFRQPPAVAAGLALRGARRDESFDVVHQLLASMVGAERSQLHIAAAAAALMPDEVGAGKAHRIRQTLKHIGVAYGLPNEVLVAWGMSDLGAPRRGNQAQVTITNTPPPSVAVRTRLARALGPALHRVSNDVHRRVLEVPVLAAAESLCEISVDHPEVLSQVLKRDGLVGGPPLSVRAQESIGLAATRHPEIRDRLIRLWRNDESAHRYPAHALEPLITRGDVEAARVFAEWLPSIPQLRGLFGGPTPATDVITNAIVRPVAARLAADTWAYAVEGREDSDGRRSWLAPTVAGGALAVLAPAWRDDSTYRHGLLEWTSWSAESARERSERLTGALQALQHVGLLTEEKRLAAAGIADVFESCLADSGFLFTRATLLLDLAHAAGLVPHLLRLLAFLAQPGTALAPHAAALLVPHLEQADARELARVVAEGAWNALYPAAIRPGPLAGLVNAAPENWAASLRRGLLEDAIAMADAVAYLDVLPAALRADVAKVWMRHASHAELPWTTERLNEVDAWRPADRVRAIVFDLGLERWE